MWSVWSRSQLGVKIKVFLIDYLFPETAAVASVTPITTQQRTLKKVLSIINDQTDKC